MKFKGVMITVIRFVLIIHCMSCVMLFYAFCYAENAVMLLFDTTHPASLAQHFGFGIQFLKMNCGEK